MKEKTKKKEEKTKEEPDSDTSEGIFTNDIPNDKHCDKCLRNEKTRIF